jgi:heat shock protein HslJ
LRHLLRLAAVGVAALTMACGTAEPTAGPTDPLSAGAGSVLETLQVAPWRVECTGVGPQMCLQVRGSSDRPWTLLHDEIAGFDYEAGYVYEIRVREDAVANPPADASAVRRTLVAILGKTPAAPSLAGPTWRLVSLDGRDIVTGTRVTASFGADDRVAGSAGCNRYTGHAAAADGRLQVGLMAATRMFCGADGVMEQEAAYLDALGRAASYRIAGTELQIGPRPGVVSLRFRVE